MFIRFPVALLALCATPFAAVAASASEFQDLEALDVAVAASMGADIGQPGGARAKVDRRLKLKACPDVPTVSGPVLGAAVVRCQPIGWSIRVPLTMQAAAAPGPALGRSSNTARDAVARGQAVRLVVEGNGFALSRTMIADRDGKIGDMISVRSDRRAQPILVRVIGMGEVAVPSS